MAESSGGYWGARSGARLSRRRLLTSLGFAGAGLAGAALIGCASGTSKVAAPATGTQPASPAGAPAPATPKKGGTWRLAMASEPATLDPHGGNLSTVTKSMAGAVYSRLLAYETGPGKPKVNFNTIPDAARSIEMLDAKTYTLKLDPKAQFTTPVNRPLTSADVKFTYERFTGKIAGAPPPIDTQLASMVDTVGTPDASTVIFKLKEPYGAFAHVLADSRALLLMPVETGRAAFDPAKTMVGSGPWLFREYRPGGMATYRRNPAWHLGPDRPYMDALELNIIRDAATALSQFLSGNLDTVTLATGDIKRAQESIKGLQLVSTDVSGINNITFSALAPDAPWKDVRVRRAVSMALDRDQLLDAAYGLKDLKALGIDVPYRWSGFLPWGVAGYWLDPKQMRPENAAAFKFAPAEAAKLLDAAGVKSGFAADWHYTSGYRGGYPILGELVPQMLKAIKINLRSVVEDYASVFIVQTFAGNYQGMGSIAYALGEPGNYLASLYIPGSPRNTGRIDDAKLTEMINKLQANPNPDERRQQMLDAQEHLATNMYNVPLPMGPTYSGYQPNTRNVVDYQSQGYSSAVDQTSVWWKA